jgi:formate-dependent nitrite reductase membrane component NrfD
MTAEHFASPPHWEWWIAGYFFLAGLAGGCYVLATIMRMWGCAADTPLIRLGYLLPLPLVIVCAIFLTVDLGQPLRFWHMLINTTPGNAGLNFKYWSPMSVGVWGLTIFGFFSFLAFLESRETLRLPSFVAAIGSIFALYIMGYTGVLLSVSNQPIWSDTYALGGLFLASGLSGSAALLVWLGRRDAQPQTEARLGRADAYFAVLELAFIAALFATLALAGTLGRALAPLWLVLWIVVIATLVPGIRAAFVRQAHQASTGVAIAVIAGVLLMRLVVIFSAQF